jgi:hypothetical protein
MYQPGSRRIDTAGHRYIADKNGTLRRVEEIEGAIYLLTKWSKGRKRAERAAQRKRHHPSLSR